MILHQEVVTLFMIALSQSTVLLLLFMAIRTSGSQWLVYDTCDFPEFYKLEARCLMVLTALFIPVLCYT